MEIFEANFKAIFDNEYAKKKKKNSKERKLLKMNFHLIHSQLAPYPLK